MLESHFPQLHSFSIDTHSPQACVWPSFSAEDRGADPGDEGRLCGLLAQLMESAPQTAAAGKTHLLPSPEFRGFTYLNVRWVHCFAFLTKTFCLNVVMGNRESLLAKGGKSTLPWATTWALRALTGTLAVQLGRLLV